MSTLKPKYWVFLIPDGSDSTYILYAPVHKVAVRISTLAHDVLLPLLDGEPTDGSTESEEMLGFLQEHKLLTLPRSWHPQAIRNLKSDHKITLSLTNKCNLRCVYCYAETGLDFTTIPWEVAQDAIDYIIAETLESGDKHFSITFHGGGEATVELKLLRRCVEYALEIAQKNDLVANFSAVTNATLITSEIAQWMKEVGFTHLTVSLDGVKEVNDLQRPRADGTGSFDGVLEGIRNLQSVELKFSLRSTVTNLGVCRMTEFVEFVAEEIFPHGGTIHFEPMSLCGRATDATLTTDAALFLENYISTKRKGGALDVKVTCSMDTFKQEKKRFCGANYCTMFCVSPAGRVSACSRVTKVTDAGADLFFYADHVPDTHTFVVNDTQRERVLAHGALPGKCETCFARWNCQGDCPIARYAYANHHEQSCIIITELLRQALLEELAKKS